MSFSVAKGETLGLVGESGSGKTTVARTILRLLDPDEGSIIFDGVDIAALSRSELQAVRRRMQMVFQDPYSSLNPRMKVASAIAEPALVHGVIERSAVTQHVGEMLDLVGLPSQRGRAPPTPALRRTAATGRDRARSLGSA